MQHFDWIILGVSADPEAPSLRVVELAAQHMRGWEPFRPPFSKLITIPGEEGASYEIKGHASEPARSVYASFAKYVGDLPLVAYDLDDVMEQVLKPEWARLKIAPIGHTGFCALRLIRRLLDPLPAAGCKLMSLHKFYQLPLHLVSLALADVLTVADIMTRVLHPIAEQRGLDTWEKLSEFAREEWYPSQLTFGKFKGKPFREARGDPEMRAWIERLAASSNEQSASMGRWYLQQIEQEPKEEHGGTFIAAACHAAPAPDGTPMEGVVLYTSPDLQRLRGLIANSRARLAELESTYTSEKSNVVALQAQMFQRLRAHHEERDRLRVLVAFRQKFINTLLRDGEEEAGHVRDEYQQADANTQKEYEDTEAEMQAKHRLSETEEAEIKILWRKLVKLFHPDRFAHDPQMQETYTKLTGVINTAKDNGDLETLRQIAEDPNGYILRQGWTAIDLGDSDELEQLQKLFNSLEAEILEVIEALGALHESSAYKLYKIVEDEPEALDGLVELQAQAVQKQVTELQTEAERLKNEITELTGEDAPGV
jgi:DNA polymerase-3 subunit epsilon